MSAIPTEQIAIIAAALAAFIYAMSYAVRTTADIGSKRAEKDRLAAEVSANLATAVAEQLKALADEVKRLTAKLDITEEKLDVANGLLDKIQGELIQQRHENEGVSAGQERRIDKLRTGLEKDGDRETLDKVLATDDKDKLAQEKDTT